MTTDLTTCHVTLRTIVAGGIDEVFDRIRAFDRYPEYTDAVHRVDILDTAADPDAGASIVSQWSVAFRGGELRWTERDTTDEAAHTIRFEQVEGDFASFTGTWQVAPADTGVSVVFTCDFDLGIPSLAPLLNPVAVRALVANMTLILRGLLGEGVDVIEELADAGVA